MDSTLYHDIVLRHKREPHRFGALENHTHASEGINALCGDRLHLDVVCRDGVVEDLRFNGESCAITTASASIMGDLVVGKNAQSIESLARKFSQYIENDNIDDEGLGELRAFAELRRHAARRKCALLPWATLRAALSGAVVATTEMAGLSE